MLVWSRRFTSNAELRRQAIEQWDIQVMASGEGGCPCRRHQHSSGTVQGHAWLRRCRDSGSGQTGCHAHQHGSRRGARFRRTRRRGSYWGLRVGLDVFANEPTGAEGSSMIRRVATQRHRNASHRGIDRSGTGRHRRRDGPGGQDLFETGRVPNVESGEADPATYMLAVRHRDWPGVLLAHVFEQLRQAHLNAGDREHHLRGRRGCSGPHQSRWGAAGGHENGHSVRTCRCPRPAAREIMKGMATAADLRTPPFRRPCRAPAARPRGGPARSGVAAGAGHVDSRISHRSKNLEVHPGKNGSRPADSYGIPFNAHCFFQGGASLQFSMVPMNLLTSGATADYIITGGWAQKALKEAPARGCVNIAASTGPIISRVSPSPTNSPDTQRRLRALHEQQHVVRYSVAG